MSDLTKNKDGRRRNEGKTQNIPLETREGKMDGKESAKENNVIKEESKMKGKLEERKGKSEGPRRGSLARPQIKIPYLAQIERRISMDILDHSGKVEGLKLIRELNRETSHYRYLAVALGGSSDCEQLRDDLRKSRQRALDLVRQAKTKLLPCLQEPSKFSSSDRKETRRLCKLLFYCTGVLEQEILHTWTLQSSFMLQTGKESLINTGVNEYLTSHKSSPPAQGAEQEAKERLLAEKNEVLALQREASEIRCYVGRNDSGTPGVKSWTLEDFGERKFLKTIMEDEPSSISSPASPFLNNENPAPDQESVDEREKPNRRRCLCWTLAILVTLVLLGSLTGTLIAFLHS